MTSTDILQTIAMNLIWQTALIAAAVFFALKFLPRSQAKTRYQIALIGLIGTLLLVAAPFMPKVNPNLTVGIAPIAQETATPAIRNTAPIVEARNDAEVMTDIAAPLSQPLPIGGVLMGIWILGSVFMFLSLALAAWKGAKWRRLAKPTPIIGSSILSKPVDILRSGHINTPLVLGLMQPVILVPKSFDLDLSKPEIRAVLEHEIAHITRHDLWVNFAQRIVLALLWWCAPLYWINSQIGIEREKLCDDIAALKISEGKTKNGRAHNGRVLARALLDLAEAQVNNKAPLLAVGIHPKAGLLAERVQRLCNTASIPKISKKLLLSTSLAVPFTLAALTTLTPSAYAHNPNQMENWAYAKNPAGQAVTVLQNALYESVERGNHKAVEKLLANDTNPNFVRHGDGTPLLVAVRKNDKRMIDILLAANADVNLAADGDGNPLIHAAMRGHLSTAKLLVEHGANVNARVLGDETPLINAARHGHLDMVKYLLANGADINIGMWSDRSDHREWRTALGEAKKHNRRNVENFLTGKGARYETRTYDPVSNGMHSEIITYANPAYDKPINPKKNASIRIVEGRVTSEYGVKRKGKKHRGIDIANKVGTPIYAPADGRINLAAEKFSFRKNYGKTENYGKTIELETAGGVKTLFAHLQGFNVEVGDIVTTGDVIGYMGNTGVSTGPHVHIETRINDNLINPDHVWPNLEP